VIPALAYGAFEILAHRFVELGLLRSAAAFLTEALGRAVLSWAILTPAILILASLAGAPWVRKPRRRLPRAMVAATLATLALLLLGRAAWSISRTEFYVTMRAGLGSFGAPAFLIVLLATCALLALRIRKSRRARFVAASAGTALLLSWLGLLAAAHYPLEREGDPPPNLILVSLDTLRADRIGCYGYERATTPGLDELAREGVLFETAVTTAPWTLPSHASMLTGLYPHHHGAIRPRGLLARRYLSLAELLADRGYAAAAFTGGGHISDRFGFGQGFHPYEMLRDTSTAATVGRALHWLEEEASSPFFLFLHTYEPHMPYRDRHFANEAEAGRVGPSFERDDLMDLRAGTWVPAPEERRYISDLYDGDARSTDAALARLWQWLRERGELDRTMIIVASDHGEELFERHIRQSVRHGHTLYDELIRVPLIIRFPPIFSGGRRVEEPASLVDVVPTVAAAFGLRWPARTDGRDLSSLGAGGAAGRREGVLTEALGSGAQRRSFRTARYKLIATLDAAPGEEELYDLVADPGETRNIALSEPGLASRFRSLLASFDPLEITEEEASIDQELEDQLRALGYVQ
jgi:arylsulfatase A-like enzyme